MRIKKEQRVKIPGEKAVVRSTKGGGLSLSNSDTAIWQQGDPGKNKTRQTC